MGVVLGIHHGMANCYALSVLEEFYPKPYEVFMKMMEKQKIDLPKGICKNLTDKQYDALYEASIVHEKPLMNRLGEDYKKILTKEKVIDLFKKM